MKTQELVLNIAVNLGRISRWAEKGNQKRINKFLEETEDYVKQLDDAPKSPRFLKTFQSFKKHFFELKNRKQRDDAWAEDVLTWGNILTHRAKFA